MRTPTAAVVALALPALLAAQVPAPPASPGAAAPAAVGGAAAPAGNAGTDNIQAILDQETAPAPGSYTYNPQGRRDPFVSLQKPVASDEGPRVRRPGLEGMLIQEIALKGIVRTPRGHIAMLQGTDGKSYFAQSGQKLADGLITGIDATTVTFRQDVTDPLSVVKVRELKKSLYQTEEARS
jgi:Tfp pilus assembly protein PilP